MILKFASLKLNEKYSIHSQFFSSLGWPQLFFVIHIFFRFPLIFLPENYSIDAESVWRKMFHLICRKSIKCTYSPKFVTGAKKRLCVPRIYTCIIVGAECSKGAGSMRAEGELLVTQNLVAWLNIPSGYFNSEFVGNYKCLAMTKSLRSWC